MYKRQTIQNRLSVDDLFLIHKLLPAKQSNKHILKISLYDQIHDKFSNTQFSTNENDYTQTVQKLKHQPNCYSELSG